MTGNRSIARPTHFSSLASRGSWRAHFFLVIHEVSAIWLSGPPPRHRAARRPPDNITCACRSSGRCELSNSKVLRVRESYTIPQMVEYAFSWINASPLPRDNVGTYATGTSCSFSLPEGGARGTLNRLCLEAPLTRAVNAVESRMSLRTDASSSAESPTILQGS